MTSNDTRRQALGDKLTDDISLFQTNFKPYGNCKY